MLNCLSQNTDVGKIEKKRSYFNIPSQSVTTDAINAKGCYHIPPRLKFLFPTGNQFFNKIVNHVFNLFCTIIIRLQARFVNIFYGLNLSLTI